VNIPNETQIESYSQISVVAEIRKKLILGLLKERGDLTAQELATELHNRGHLPSDERNFTAPRITELCLAGKVEPVDKTYCAKTGRKVTVWAVISGSKNRK